MCEGFFICRNLVGVSLSPGSLNLSSKFERPLGRPRRGEELSSESSRDAASASHYIDLMRMCEGFFIWRRLVGASLSPGSLPGSQDTQLRLLMNIQRTNIQNRRSINILCIHHLRNPLERRNNHRLLPQF